MEPMNQFQRSPGASDTRDSQSPSTPNKRVRIRLTISPSPKSLTQSPSNDTSFVAEASTAVEGSQRKDPTPEQALPAPATLLPDLPKLVEGPTIKPTNPPRESPTQMEESYTSMKVSTVRNETVAPTPSPSSAPRSQPSNRSGKPTHGKRSAPLRRQPRKMSRGSESIPEDQIACCKFLRAITPADTESHKNLVIFMTTFADTTTVKVSHPPHNVYGVIWQEYDYIIGVNTYNPHTNKFDFTFYGGQEFNKGRVDEIYPPIRPMVCSRFDAEKTNEECLIRVDCGVDFNCKTHGRWRFCAFFAKWQAPGELDRRMAEEKKLQRKQKRRSETRSGSFQQSMQGVGGGSFDTGEDFQTMSGGEGIMGSGMNSLGGRGSMGGMGGMGGSQMDDVSENSRGITPTTDGEYGFSEELSSTLGISSSKKMKVGRDDPCPCGSMKKYKVCCGAGWAKKST